MRVELDISKTLEQNATACFEKSKKAKKKIEGARTAIVFLGKRLEELRKKKASEEERKQEQQKPKREKKWYEKFRWLITSDGFMAIGGRDATTNEIVVKKHTNPEDVVFHTDMAGSPFFVLKTEGKKPTETAIRETADATCTFSRAWKLGMKAQSVFWVKPEQLSKTPNTGEYVAKGAFIVRGKTNYVDNGINCAIGIMEDGSVMGGPKEAVKKHCAKYALIEQGDDKASAVAKKIQKLIGGDLDDIIRAMPPGNAKLKK